ncbi:MAG TPA: molybdenum cofactor biosynthesis protein MoaE [Burkholderiaceae bacterium]|nr:molybdenum cofactor biosynthesis protein MoaE [Burkholderiaceae bacterium]
MAVRVQREDFDAGHEIAALRRGRTDVGAIAAFIGVARDLNDGDAVTRMSIEHYPGMTESALEEIVATACARWPKLVEALVVHRYGDFDPGDQIVLVVVASAHRGDAFQACEFLMDYLKTSAPFWKKETTPSGSRWVEAREADDAARGRWDASGAAPGTRKP